MSYDRDNTESGDRPPSPRAARSEVVGQIMTEEVVTIQMDEPLYLIQRTFQHQMFHHLLVVDEGELVGVISDRDVLSAVSPYLNTPSEQRRDQRTLQKRAHQIMSRRLVTVTKSTPIAEAGALLLKHNISCVPVVSSSIAPVRASKESHLRLIVAGRVLEGIVTWRDILCYYLEPSSA